MATIQDIARKTVEYNNQGRSRELLDEVYSQQAESHEAGPMPDGSRGASSLDAIRQKWDWWEGSHEVHSAKAEGPFFHGDDQFGVIYEIDVTEKASGNRMQMRELAVYTVDGGKIVREQFFNAF